MARVLLLLAALAVAAANLDDGPREPPDREPFGARLFQSLLIRLEPAQGLGAVAEGWGDAWASDPARGEVLRLDGGSGRVVARVPVGGRVALAVNGRGVWALRWGGRFRRRPNGPLLLIDPRTNRIAARVALRDPRSGEPVVAFGVLAGEAGVWVWGPSAVARVDCESGRLSQVIRIDDRRGELTGAAITANGVIAAAADGRLLRFGHLGYLAAGRAGLVPAGLAAVDGPRLLATAGGIVAALDGRTGRTLWQRRLGFDAGGVLVAGGTVVVRAAALGDPGDRLWALDAATGRVVAGAQLPLFGTTGLTAVRGALWVTATSGEIVVVPPLLARRFLREEFGTPGVKQGMRTPTVTEIPLPLARVEPDPFLAPGSPPAAEERTDAPPRERQGNGPMPG